MGFNPPVPQQDSNWEIRAAVLLSLFFQVLLIFLGPTRKRSSAPWFRLTVWSCYVLADWVADLALGLLLNNMGNVGTSTTGGNNDNNAAAGSSSSPVIFVFWTPFLLLHLGGPDTITAYSVEDNDLWNRHLIGLLFELFSTCVIIYCSILNNPLVSATMLMLVAGVIKYGERTYSLYSGSHESLRDSIMGPPEPGPNYARLMTEFGSMKRAGLVVEIDIASAEAEKAHKEMEEEEKRMVLDKKKSLEARAYEFFLVFRRLFVDVIISFKERRQSQAFFLDREGMKASEAFEVIEVELNFIYDMVYTKAPVAYRRSGWVLRCICSCCLVSALVIFFFLDNKAGHQIQRVDVGITYALLLGGLALDAAALLMIFFSIRAKVYLEESRWLHWLAWLRRVTKRWQTRRWSGTVPQMNLIRYCHEKPGPYGYSNKGGRRWLYTIAEKLHVEEIVDDFFFIRRVPLGGQQQQDGSPPLLDFIFSGLKPAAQKLEKKEHIMEMLNCRGKRVIQRRAKDIIKNAIGIDDDEAGRLATDIIFERSLETKYAAERLAMGIIKRSLEKGEAERLAMHIIRKSLDEKDDEAEPQGIGTDGTNNNATDIRKVARDKLKLILDSVVSKDFDESLLLWHIATDLCCLDDNYRAATESEARLRPIGETLSEYMLYLLIKQPEMLAATAGIGLRPYRDTCAEARRFFASKEAWLGIAKEDGMRRFLLSVDTSEIRPASMKGDRSKSVLFDAVILAKVLRELDEALMWDLITGVWGEMLTFAAVRGRGRTHVRSLNRGGELITFVWLLMQHVGLSDMYEIRQEDPSAKLIVHY